MDQKVSGHLQKYFKLADGTISQTGGAKRWICTLCGKVFIGSATKQRAHLLGLTWKGIAACPSISEDAVTAITAAEAENPSNKRKEPASSFGLSSSSSARQPGIAEVLKKLDKTEVDKAVASWLYVNAIPFNTVRYGS